MFPKKSIKKFWLVGTKNKQLMHSLILFNGMSFYDSKNFLAF